MFCKPPHPVYIVLFRGDDTDFVGNQEIIVKITTERNISGCKAYFKYMGNIQTFDEIPENKELHLVFSHEQTKEMPLGTWDAELYLIDENGKRMTVNNRIHMLVTNSVGEAYCPDDPQAVSVVISANKYIEDAEVSADGKTLTLTKKDGTEVSFSGGGGGGGGTNDYNDLENKPSINGTILTGNVNLATPEQLSLKADKANVYTKEDVDSRYSALSIQIGDISNSTNILSTTIDQHIRDTNNPHKVTAAQVGALPLTGGTLTGDLSVGKSHTESRTLHISSDITADGITLHGGGNGSVSSVDVGGSIGEGGNITVNGGGTGGGTILVGGSPYIGGKLTVQGGGKSGGIIEVTEAGASIKKNGKEVATEEQLAAKADKATTLAGYGITDAATMESLAPEYSPSSAYAVGAFVYHNGNIYQCTTAISDGGEAWNAAHWELRKLDDFFTESNSLLTGTIDARLPYPLYAVPSTGLLKDRTLNTTSLASVTVPDNFTDLLIRASVASSLSVTMPDAIATKYGYTFPGEAGEYLITITKTGASEAYVRTIKLEVANA